ncbi:DUF72 domain-containing protein [Staphylococcus warneri]|jgi:uncharacterized protein YecE (DUF72 family)|uniref:DUF72 domain-containing protein n=3 Tax=Staphylococcus TaxID=1279 RepID=A0A364UQY7_STAWA|nr:MULTISPECIES: DUF72 domain-containing protein [Staphylococcus]MBJ7884398.1 DUF72 domain-containing protein [Bacillaceae bacterium HSR45]MCC8989385.1 DUF72 domain-containing protein [Staphylococcus sp.]PAK73436.1 hypothetical protein B8W95_05815 [Staphylococcus pasteuri]COS95139.1 Protein of uncharacterised function DUF72 [Streptococcus pneumoniae]AGC91142.1 hypothetical protein A284_09135 [Staphylococcus warneri SG1]
MINIGLTGWGDHDTLYEDLARKSDKLKTYSSHFPIVELDASYYAIQPERNIKKWINETPERFQFVVKIHQALTLHADFRDFSETRQELFDAFKEMLAPLQESQKLAMVLVQFPPWFDCSSQNIKYILYVKQQLQDYPMCVEFRHQSWFNDQFKEETLSFLTEHQIIHAVVDEPQVKDASIPLVNRITSDIAFVRYHGRNVHGWTKKDMTDQEWRDVRYLYNYNKTELLDLAQKVKILEQKAKKVYVVFNNNSGGHAAQNAKTYQNILGIDYEGLAPQQLKLF